MKELFFSVLVEPIYNLLIFIIDVIPGGSVGLALILLVIIVRTILIPLSKKAIDVQLKMKDLQKPLEDLKLKYKDNREKLALETMDLYKKNKINPFSIIFLTLVNIPILIALYYVVVHAGLPALKPEFLYSFTPRPTYINMNLFFFDLQNKSFVLAGLATVVQIFQSRIMQSKMAAPKNDGTMMDEFSKSIQLQTKYVFPVMMGFISYTFGSVVAVYFIIGGLFTIVQEIYMKKHSLKKQKEV